jgi:hypothetical protein
MRVSKGALLCTCAVLLAGLVLASGHAATAGELTVPEFSGPATPEPGYEYGNLRGDYYKYKNEKPVVQITAANADQYADKLTSGEMALLKSKAGYRIDVYPSHRDCSFPDWVQANSKLNKSAASLDPTGNYLVKAVLPGLPFSDPKNGAEIMWNYLARYRGVGLVFPSVTTAVSPRPGSTEWIEATGYQTNYYPYGKKGQTSPVDVGDLLFGVQFGYEQPAALAGQGVVQRIYFKQPTETYYYFPGQRRVRRMPAYQYDAPQIGFENNYTLDEPQMFVGPIDRFDWKIVGKKELIVPYHSFGIYDFKKKFHDIAQDNFINPDSRHYELHTVWVVEGTAKADARHAAPKKIIYFDVDSFLAVLGEDYDAQGKLWKVREGYALPIWELGGGTCDVVAFAQYDLLNGRYLFDQASAGQGKDMHWLVDAGGDTRFNDSYYSAESLRGISER